MFSEEQILMFFDVYSRQRSNAQRFEKIKYHPLMKGWKIGAKDLTSNTYSWFYMVRDAVALAKTRKESPSINHFYEAIRDRLTPRGLLDRETLEKNFSSTLKSVVPPKGWVSYNLIEKSFEGNKESKRLQMSDSNKTIIAYEIISAKNKSHLESDVAKKMKSGWQPLGGVSAAAFGMSPVGGNQYIQAMVLYSD